MRIAVIGGGPGGLYFAALIKSLDARHEVAVWERNAASDTFGFGVVLSDETLGGIEHADQVVYRQLLAEFASWDDIDVHLRDSVTTVGGQGFSALSRKRLLQILQERCAGLGVQLHFSTLAPDADALMADNDLVIAADGANSMTRDKFADVFEPSLETRHSKYMWLGTDLVFDAFKFYVRETHHGVMQIHGYPYSRDHSTFIIEMHDDVWHRAGFAQLAAAVPPIPGRSDEASIAKVRELFGDILGGHRTIGNNSKWLNFVTVRNQSWCHDNLVLLGDAAHTAHFSIGSGTKLAMEDALALAACLYEESGIDDALAAYAAERRPVVLSTQRAAQASLEWFERVGQYVRQEPLQFAFNIMTRSRRITYDNLRLRDPGFVDRMDDWFAESEARRGKVPAAATPRPPMFQPFNLRGLELINRVVVSPMDMYSAVDGDPTEFHLVHLGARALGGAALVFTEMVCVSPTGRISPGCAGLYTPRQEQLWRRVVDFVHGNSQAKIGLQLGHSGRKGSTKLMWEGIDDPLPDGNWPVVGPSAIRYSPANQTPQELTRDEMQRITGEFVASAEAGARAGFDVLELHCGHGYLLSSFISPLSNQRTDDYGGALQSRLRYPLEVFDAVREAWPRDRPMSVRISATDWFEGGNDSDDAVEIARAFAQHGAAAIHVSTGQVVKAEQPAFGRSYQTPFADRIRNEVGLDHDLAVIAVGAISSHDDVNSVLLAGRADLVALGRPHLYDPHWTVHAAADQGYAGSGVAWPDPYLAGNRKPPTGRIDGAPPRLELVRPKAAQRPSRWRPGSA